MKLLYQLILFTGVFQIVISGGTNYDATRWITSYRKPATLSSTDGGLEASFATDGNFKAVYTTNPETNFSMTLTEASPWLRIDLGKSLPVCILRLIAPTYPGVGTQNRLVVRIGDSPIATQNPACGAMFTLGNPPQWKGLNCRMKGRYIDIIRDIESPLRIAEAVVFCKPLENIAYKKKTANSSSYDSNNEADKAVDMLEGHAFVSKAGSYNWMRVDLDDSHLIHEVLFFARACCSNNPDAHHGFELRIGDSLANDGNSNPLCVKYDLEVAQMRSFYCDMFGRYVNINRAGLMYVAEIIINPETTENVAVLADVSIDIDSDAARKRHMVDTHYSTFFTGITDHKDRTKRITINLGADYNVAMILIVNEISFLNELIDFKIAIGMTNAFSDSTLCVPGVQDMAGILVKSFYCTPDRISGNHVFIDQGAGKQIAIRELGVYEETKPKIVDHSTNRYIWSKEGGEITLECDAEGYPAPAISWVKEKELLESGPTTLQLSNLKLNDSQVIECWANNSNGFDARLYALEITSELRMCVKNRELKFQTGQSQTVEDAELQGNMFYRFTDAQKYSDLKFYETSPPKTNPSCKAWLKEKHPSLKDGVVSRQLCIRDQGDDCHSTLDIYVRRCTHHYVYNFKKLRDLSQMKFCMQSVNLQHGLRPLMTSSKRHFTLSEKTFHTEENFQESFECLVLCQLDNRCKSFNFSKKLQLCELNSATKKEFPGNLVSSKNFDHYHVNRGVVKHEL